MISLTETLGNVAAEKGAKGLNCGALQPTEGLRGLLVSETRKTELKPQSKGSNGDKILVSTLGVPLLMKIPRFQTIPNPASLQIDLRGVTTSEGNQKKLKILCAGKFMGASSHTCTCTHVLF